MVYSDSASLTPSVLVTTKFLSDKKNKFILFSFIYLFAFNEYVYMLNLIGLSHNPFFFFFFRTSLVVPVYRYIKQRNVNY